MIAIRQVAVSVVVAAVLAVGCDRAGTSQVSPVGPSQSFAQATAHVRAEAVSCKVDIGATVHPLPAVHLLQAWLNISIQNVASSLNCGQVQSLQSKMSVVAEKLDQDPPNFDAACGVSTALLNELQSLVRRGELATPTFSPPVPGGPTTVLAAAKDLNQHWCDAAHGGLTGPRS
jgi:hypothetical protein